MGPTVILDNSAFEALSLDESVWLEAFTNAIVVPVFHVEVLADLEKRGRRGQPPRCTGPAFRGGLGIFPVPGRGNVSGYRITARELATGRPRWRFRGDGYLDSAPLIASGLVFLGSGSGRVYGVRLRSGRRVWRVGLQSPVPAAGFGTAGLAAAERTLFVPVVGRLHAFR